MDIVLNQEINLSEVLRDAKPQGIIHAGAYIGGCSRFYDKFPIKNRCWIEADPESYNKLVENVPASDVKLNVAVSDRDGSALFLVTNNGQSSSLLPLKKHRVRYPTIVAEKQIIVPCRRFDTLVEQGLIDMYKYNFLLMDLQGAEYLALKGFEKNINKIGFIVAEINYEELYEGCMLAEDFDEYLLELGFVKIMATKYENLGWGDAYYKRKSS